LQPTAGFMTHVTCRLTAKNRDQLRNPTLGNQGWSTFFIVSRTTTVARAPYLVLMSECVGQCSPVGRHVVDTEVAGLVVVQLDPVGRVGRGAGVVERFGQVEGRFSISQPHEAGVTARCAPRHRNLPQVTAAQTHRHRHAALRFMYVDYGDSDDAVFVTYLCRPIFTPVLLRTHSFVFVTVYETRRIFLGPFVS